MKKILNIIASPRGAASFSNRLGQAIADKIIAENAGSTLRIRNLNETPYPHVEAAHLAAFFTPEENLTKENREAIKHSDEAVKELFDADVIIISTPMWNFSIPSVLKAWIDHIARAGLTFSYGEAGPVGLLTGKKIYIALASGGIYTEGPTQGLNFAEPYLKSFLGFLGMTDITVFRAEGTSYPVIQDTALEKAIESIAL
jgi:FMN-dependent NADH-azoreductase